MDDLRQFNVIVDGVVEGTYDVRRAREVATVLHAKYKVVTLQNAETLEIFKWWPELGCKKYIDPINAELAAVGLTVDLIYRGVKP